MLYTFCSWSQTAVDPQAAAFLPAAESLNATIRGDRVAGGIAISLTAADLAQRLGCSESET